MSKENKKLIYLVFIFAAMIGLSYVKGITKINKEVQVVVSVSKPVSSKEIYLGKADDKKVIFTFDGGSGNQSTIEILNTLEKHKVKSTFFLTGKWVESNPYLVYMMNKAGHEIYNHTYNHPYLTSLNEEEIKNELNLMDQALYRVIGKSSKPYFRPPYGDRDERVKFIAASEGYQSVFWTTDAMDWLELSGGETNDSVINRINVNLRPGAIYLMHIGDKITGEILDKVLTDIQNLGYEIVPLTQGI